MDYSKLSLFSLTSKKMTWLSSRQQVIAENVANSDTPGYKAKDISSFDSYLQGSSKKVSATVTNPNHISRNGNREVDVEVDKDAWGSNINGNTVSLEQQSIKSAEIRETYAMATNLYKKGYTLVRTAIGNR